jgi:TonB-linked SusC/RagA family outer membrane protein
MMRTVRSILGLGAVLVAAVLPVSLAAQQAATITGRVLAEGGSPLAGAIVTIPGAGLGTLTGGDGTYSLLVPAARLQLGTNVTLSAEMIGYASETANVQLTPGGAIQQSFTLTLDPLRLAEIVVTGAGTATRAERLGTARATVDANMITRANEVNIVSALALKAPNVITTQSSGEPGAGTSIRIRGTTTLAGLGQPLVVVDGVPVNNESRELTNSRTVSPLGANVTTNRAMDINPDDIETIEILKGPAATSIFGAAAGAGGAILITTKRGRPGLTRYSFRSSLQFDEVQHTIPLQTKFGSGTGGAATACLVNRTPGCTHNNPTWGPALAAGVPTFDHANEIYETGQLFDNTLALSGGSESTRFYLSVGALNHDGFIVTDNDQFKRYTVRLNADHQLRNNLRIGGNMSYVQTKGSFIGRGNNVNGFLLGALRTPPEFNNQVYLDSVFGFHRTYRFPAPRAQDFVNLNRGFDNPFFAINMHPNLGEVARFFGNVNWNWQAQPWLELNHTVGFDYASDDRTEAVHPSAAGTASGGTVTRWQFYDRVLDHTLVARASRAVNESVRGSLSVGQNLNEKYFRQINVDAQQFIAPLPYKLQNTVNRSLPSDQESRRRLEGYFGQLEVDVADQLFLTARIRNDGASTFGRESKRAWYPGAQAAWTITDMFNPLPNQIGFAKLRVAYGESGQEPDVYQLQDIFTNLGLNDFNPGSIIIPTLGGFGGVYTSNIKGNPNLSPERVKELEAGVDLSLFSGRADASITYYDKDAEDIIFSVDLPPSTGASSIVANAGAVENQGWELSLNVRPLQSENLGVTLGANWAKNDSEVLDLGSVGTDSVGNPIPRTVTSWSQSFFGNTTHWQVGQPVGVFRGFGFARCGTGIATRDAAMVQACQGAPAGALFIGTAGLPVSDPDERVIGNPNPDWTAGINAEVAIRGVRVAAFLDHRQGGQVVNMTRGSLQSLGVHANTLIRDQPAAPFNTWPLYSHETVVGPGKDVAVQLGQAWFGNLGGLGTREHLMEDATFTRLREVSLAYTLTQPFVRDRLGLTSLDLRVSARNLKLWTDYTGSDPETHTGGAAVANRGIDWFVNPASKALVVSVGLTR